MLDCSRCGNALPLTLPGCPCGADLGSALDGVALVCDRCEAAAPPGSAACPGCGEALGTGTGTGTETGTDETGSGSETGADETGSGSETGAGPEAAAAAASSSVRAERSPAERGGVEARGAAPGAAAATPPADGPPVLQRTGRARRGAPIVHAFPGGRAGAPPRVRVVARREDGRMAAVSIGPAPAICGRTEGELRLPAESVSRRHARFRLEEGQPYAEDLGSLNGTWIRLRRPRKLELGDELRLGSRRLRLAWTPTGPALEELDLEGGATAIHPLRGGATVLGRAGDVSFPEEEELAREHARVEVTASGVGVTDLATVIGTWVRLRAPEPLSAGDELLLGAERVTVEPIP